MEAHPRHISPVEIIHVDELNRETASDSGVCGEAPKPFGGDGNVNKRQSEENVPRPDPLCRGDSTSRHSTDSTPRGSTFLGDEIEELASLNVDAILKEDDQDEEREETGSGRMSIVMKEVDASAFTAIRGDLVSDDPGDADFKPDLYRRITVSEHPELEEEGGSSSEESTSSKSEAINPAKRGRGRPRQNSAVANNNSDEDDDTDTTDESSDSDDDDLPSEPDDDALEDGLGEHFLSEMKVNSKPEQEWSTADSYWTNHYDNSPSLDATIKDEEKPVKKKRGRPRKRPLTPAESEDDTGDSDDDVYDSDDSRPRKRGRGRPRKRRKMFQEDDPNTDWDVNYQFACHKCNATTTGFQPSVDHMDKQHPIEVGNEEERSSFQCVLCSRPFGRKDHLKRHVEGHVAGRIPFGDEAVKRQKKGMAQEKALPFKYDDWSTYRIFSCYKCGKEAKGFRATWLHMKEKHMWKQTDPILNELSDGEGSDDVLCRPDSSARSEKSDDSCGRSNCNAEVKQEKEHDLSKIVEVQLFCFQCILCPRAYVRRDHLKMHVWRHVNSIEPTPIHTTRGYTKSWAEVTMWGCKKCPEVGLKFAGLSAFVQHNRVEHGQQLGYQCPVCDKRNFSKKDQLRAHVQTHNEVKLPCEFCGKLFADGNKMKRHVNEVHEKLKNYMCNTCGKCFARKDKLRAHEIVHANANEYKPYLCHICGRGFGRQEHVSRHQKVCGQRQRKRQEVLEEEEEDPDKELLRLGYELGLDAYEKDQVTGMFHCRECNHQFKDRRYIAEHYARNHREENLKLPYRCDECGRGYKIKKDLIRHQNKPHVHNDQYMEKAFVCDELGCGRRFGREFELKRHEKIHQGIREYKCSHCDAEFHMRQCLKTHMRSVHDVDLPKAVRRRKHLISEKGDKDPKKTKRQKKRFPKKSSEENHDEEDLDANSQDVQEHERAISNTGALNLSSTNSHGSLDQWIPQGLSQGYFGHHAVQTGQHQFSSFAHWMSVGLEQPTVVSPSSNYYHDEGTAGTLTPAGSLHKESDKGSNRSPTPSQDRASTVDHSQVDQHETHKQLDRSQRVDNDVAEDDFEHESWDDEKKDRKTRKNQGAPMTDEERVMYEESVSEKKLGSICSVCGKVFRNKDALEFHIMTTKMPGHGVLQVQKMKSHYAFASMQVSAKLNEVSRGDDMKPDMEALIKDNCVPPDFEVLTVEKEEEETGAFIDPKTGECVVKQEPKCEGVREETAKTKSIVNLPVKVTIKAEPEDSSFKKSETSPKKKAFGKNKIFKCMECQKGFKKQAKLIKHVMKRHKSSLKKKSEEEVNADIHELTKNARDKMGRWPCVICGKSLANKQKLQRHIMEVHQRLRQHICRICKKGFARAEKLRQHEEEVHDEEELKQLKPIPVPGLPVLKKEPLFKNGPQLRLMPMGCLDCEQQFEDKDEIMEHMAGAPHFFKNEAEEIKCPILTCNLKFTSIGRLVQHLRVGKHNQPCPSCGKKFRRLDKLEIHLRCHSSDRPFACDMCDKSYKDPTSLQFHKKTHSGARPYLCPDCGAGFMKPDHLKRHVNSTHLKIKNIKCQFCDMYFSDKYKARIHERKHTGETPYLCSICAKAFKRKEALDQHAIVHKDLPRDFKCMTCSATFKSQQYLNRHVSRHFAEKRWRCPKCPSAFIDKRDLVTHDKHVHQNLRPFVCEYCGSAYKTKQGLQIHAKSYSAGDCINMKRFSGRGANRIDLDDDDDDEVPELEIDEDKPFECPECQKRFAKKSRMEWHLRMHSNTRLFPCTVEGCSRSFTQNQTLRAHIKQFHQMDLPTLPRAGGRKRINPTAAPIAPQSPSPVPIRHLSQEVANKGQQQRNFAASLEEHNTVSVKNREEAYVQKAVQKMQQRPFSHTSPVESPAPHQIPDGVVASIHSTVQHVPPHLPPRIPPELLPRLDMLAVQSRVATNHSVIAVNQARVQHHQGRHHTADQIPQFMLHHQQQMFQQQQQQQLQQHHRQLHQQQQQQQQLQQHSHMNAFPGMPPNFVQSSREVVDQHLAANPPTPLDFYQYAANFANINHMYRN